MSGHRGERAHTVHQSLAQAPVPKLRPAKFLLGPAIALEPLGRLERPGNDRFDYAQALSEIFHQRIHIDGFDALGTLVLPVLAPASLGLADLNPVRRLIAGASKAIGLNEALDQPGTVAVLRLEIALEPTQPHPQHARGQIVTAYRRPDQKTLLLAYRSDRDYTGCVLMTIFIDVSTLII